MQNVNIKVSNEQIVESKYSGFYSKFYENLSFLNKTEDSNYKNFLKNSFTDLMPFLNNIENNHEHLRVEQYNSDKNAFVDNYKERLNIFIWCLTVVGFIIGFFTKNIFFYVGLFLSFILPIIYCEIIINQRFSANSLEKFNYRVDTLYSKEHKDFLYKKSFDFLSTQLSLSDEHKNHSFVQTFTSILLYLVPPKTNEENEKDYYNKMKLEVLKSSLISPNSINITKNGIQYKANIELFNQADNNGNLDKIEISHKELTVLCLAHLCYFDFIFKLIKSNGEFEKYLNDKSELSVFLNFFNTVYNDIVNKNELIQSIGEIKNKIKEKEIHVPDFEWNITDYVNQLDNQIKLIDEQNYQSHDDFITNCLNPLSAIHSEAMEKRQMINDYIEKKIINK